MFEKILVPLDGSLVADCVLPHVAAMAQTKNRSVTLLRVMEAGQARGTAVNAIDWQLKKSEAQSYLEETGEALRAGVAGEPKAVLLEGRAAERIIEYADQEEIDLIVISSHGENGLHRWNVSSTTQKIIYRAGRSVLLVRAYQADTGANNHHNVTPIQYHRILVPLDGSQRAEHVLTSAAALAERHGAELLLVHVATKPTMMQRMPLTSEDATLVDQIFERNQTHAERYFEQLRGRLPENTQTFVLTDTNVPAVLHNFVNQNAIDLVLLSAHGASGDGQWPFGSIVSSFVNFGMTPLLIMQDMPGRLSEPMYVERISRSTQMQRSRTAGGENVPDETVIKQAEPHA
ncbi:MAG: universal stress protein [Caldilineaceae bacterium]|nr:universal stress protein [Caldilineaceae bacterium]